MEKTANNADLERKFRHFIESADRNKGMMLMAAVSHAEGSDGDAVLSESRRILNTDDGVRMLALLMYAGLRGFDRIDRPAALDEAAGMVHAILRMRLDEDARPIDPDDNMPDADPAVPMQ